ncbi:hypothetical protein PIB30_008934 [Stylosanthes scabra]|uniref:Uncharacterized protein n=1 Tax=Stylosanthes scabra TaxID=79078 RepID=A0ABU6R5I2_9FABA|nr:hypothetical protein [Stylosanthes scabra]
MAAATATSFFAVAPTLSLKHQNANSHRRLPLFSISPSTTRRFVPTTISCNPSNNNHNYVDDDNNNNTERPQSNAIQLYSQIERLVTDSVRQSQDGWWGSRDWSELEGAWVIKPKISKPKFVAHFIGGIFVGAAPQLAYRWFLERLSEKGVVIIATPYASGFDHFQIADEVQFKFDRCYRALQETIQDLPIFGVGHSLGSVVHLLIGSRYAVQRSGNVLMAFNNKEASSAVPLFSPVIVPMAQSIGPLLSDIFASPTLRAGAEMTLKQFENVSPPIMKQVLPLVEQLPPLYMDLVKGREEFIPRPEETRRLVCDISDY